MKYISRLPHLLIGILIIAALIMSGCTTAPAGTSPSTSGPTPTTSPSTAPAPASSGQQGGNGTVEVRVTDAPPRQEVTGVEVTVESVEIHKAGAGQEDEKGWLPMALSGPSTFDLLQIRGIEQVLATANLTAGKYTQIRMNVTRVRVSFREGQPVDATVPSGKLKFVRPFDVVAGQATVLLFDFDADKSVNVTGNGKAMFKPVIKLTVTKAKGGMEIVTPSLPNGEVGVAYNGAVAATGGLEPYTWSISAGALPAGLALNPVTGAITGTPTGAGDSTFTVKAEDSSPAKKSATRSFTVNIAGAGVLQITTTSLAGGTKNVAYSATVQAVGGTIPYTWSISAGALPAGLALNPATGAITGTPTAAGNFSFTVRVTDSAAPTANTDTQALAIHIAEEVTP
ncbi:MAG: putative Ig protein [Dehalococcoidia bacterium]|nr:putative Ig protein [Dehalococcoidia bacterium]